MAVTFSQQCQSRFCQNLSYITRSGKKCGKNFSKKKARKQISCLRAKKDFRRDFTQRSTARITAAHDWPLPSAGRFE
jgi:hypothetical protein